MNEELLQKSLKHSDPDAIDMDAYKALAFIKGWMPFFVTAGNNLLLTSPGPGTGKTSWAIRLVRVYASCCKDQGLQPVKAMFVSVPRLFSELKQSIANGTDTEYTEWFKARVYDSDVIIWDEIATKGYSDYEAEQLFAFVDSRILNKRSNIFTTNKSTAELEACIGPRLYSRIVNTAFVITLAGSDKRNLSR